MKVEGFASTLLLPLAWLYAAGAGIHRRVGRARARREASRSRPACFVLSVGGLSLGGDGKTPLAAFIAATLARRGRRVVLASRGYKGSARAPVTLVSEGGPTRLDAAVAGDEALVLAAHAPGVPVLIGRDRRAVVERAVLAHGAEIVVLDDGFQHHRLVRDLDLVCLDAQAGLGNGRVVPAGPLRESSASLADADALCLVGTAGGSSAMPGATGTTSEAASTRRVAEAFAQSGRPVYRALRKPSALVRFGPAARAGGGAPDRLEFGALRGRAVGLVCGVARPASFRGLVESLGAEVVAVRPFADHHAYRPRDLEGLAAEAPLWLTTEKDAGKLRPEWLGGVELWVIELEVAFEGEEAFFAGIERALDARISTRPARSTA